MVNLFENCVWKEIGISVSSAWAAKFRCESRVLRVLKQSEQVLRGVPMLVQTFEM